jgi:hypothetical protein
VKLESLRYDIRRPLTPTGTNLLGWSSTWPAWSWYFGETFGLPSSEPLPWLGEGAQPNADMGDPGESRITLHRAWLHSDTTIDALPLDAVGHVPGGPRTGTGDPAVMAHMSPRRTGTRGTPISSGN